MKTFMLNKKKEKEKEKNIIYIYIYIYYIFAFRANGIRLRIQFRSFVFDQKHFKYQAIEFATEFLEDFRVFNLIVRC